jgi:hypothetical protein
VKRDPGDYLWERGGAAVLVDGVRYAEVQRGLERHGLDVAEGVVPELELGVQHHLLFSACVLLLSNCKLLAEHHGAGLLLCLTCVASWLQNFPIYRLAARD